MQREGIEGYDRLELRVVWPEEAEGFDVDVFRFFDGVTIWMRLSKVRVGEDL